MVADKLIANFTEWARVGRGLELQLPLEINGVVEEQLFFRAAAIAAFPGQQVTFQLAYTA